MNVFQILVDSAERYGDAIAVVDERGELSFRELLELARDVQSHLEQYGVKKGMGVGIQVPNGREFIAALFAVAACEAVAVPFGEGMTFSEVKGLIDDLPVSGVLFSDIPSTRQEGECSEFSLSDLTFAYVCIEEGVPNFAPHVPNAVFVRPTSGTTGKSKGVVFSHKTVQERIDAAQETLMLSPADSVIWVLPMAYHFVVSIVLYIKTGSKIVVCKDHLADTVLDAAAAHKGTVLYASPTHYALLAHSESEKKLPELRWAICTSGGISAKIAREFESLYSIPLRQVYGVIEVGLPVGNMQKPPAPVGSIGKTLQGFEAALLRADGMLCAPGEEGELALRGPGMFDAYLQPAADRESKLADGWFLTGDFATMDNDQNIFVCGRKKSVIIVAGNKVFPEEVEHTLNDHPSIEVSRVYGSDHPFVGEVVSAEVVLQEGEGVSAEELRKFCRGKLSSFKTPQSIQFVDSVNMTGSGKVVRH
jgi:acyl-coenzyme A synthetase/AMP-(fatty) acid ligase